ncbi:MAG: hypothetical protein ABI794_11760 [Betaproteobacteria bacterium]
MRQVRKRRSAVVVGLVVALGLAGCSRDSVNFSQYPGFAAYFSAHPRSSRLPDAGERALLERHRPRWQLPLSHPGAIAFYEDYIANGTLVSGDGRARFDRVTRAILNGHRDDSGAVFTHRPPVGTVPPAVVFARIDRAPLAAEAEAGCVTVLTYHAVFRSSGLPAGFGGLGAGALGLVANLDDWHQLDHYTAVTIVLDAAAAPVALMLQQHNMTHTWVLGFDLPAPDDGRPAIDVALRSNELYPHQPGRMRHRTIQFPTPEGIRYLLGYGDAPFMSADDVTDGAVEADYALGFLPHDDAFYDFQGRLGARRRLPGRDGPPGADFNTLPELKPLYLQLAVGYWREGNRDDLETAERSFGRTGDPLDFARAQLPVLMGSLRRVSPSIATADCDPPTKGR